jgi:hypothetical protein
MEIISQYERQFMMAFMYEISRSFDPFPLERFSSCNQGSAYTILVMKV